MSKRDVLLRRILSGTSDANIAFSDLCGLLLYLGFDERQRGSHHIFRKEGVGELINLQRDGRQAKSYHEILSSATSQNPHCQLRIGAQRRGG